MKTIRLSVVDVHPRMPRTLLEFVADRYRFELVRQNADFVLHSCSGREVLNHRGVRIGFVGENLVPDFNVSDYALGFSRLEFGDRYFRLPLYRIWNKDRYRALTRPRSDVSAILAAKTGFCSCVVSNGKRDTFLARAFDAIARYKPIESGGRWRNNAGGPVRDKITFCSRSKFALVCENSSASGYITEKIVDAMVSSAIPIYWGAHDVAEDFNPNALINCHEFPTLEALVARIAEVDQNNDLYLDMLTAPCFAGGGERPDLTDERIAGFLASIFDQSPGEARRANRTFWGEMYVSQARRAWFRPDLQALWLLQSWFRRRRNERAARGVLRESIDGMYEAQ